MLPTVLYHGRRTVMVYKQKLHRAHTDDRKETVDDIIPHILAQQESPSATVMGFKCYMGFLYSPHSRC
jgi:hypothetical protein